MLGEYLSQVCEIFGAVVSDLNTHMNRQSLGTRDASQHGVWFLWSVETFYLFIYLTGVLDPGIFHICDVSQQCGEGKLGSAQQETNDRPQLLAALPML